jgi:O-antigen/teichoic acid export membrane protein
MCSTQDAASKAAGTVSDIGGVLSATHSLGRVLKRFVFHPVGQASALRILAVLVGLAGSIAMARLGGVEVKGIAAAYAATNTLVFTAANFDFAQQALRWGRSRGRLDEAFPVLISGWLLYISFAIILGMLGALAYLPLMWISVGAVSYLLSAQVGVAAVGISGARVTATGAVVQQSAMLGLVLAFNEYGGLSATSAKVAIIVSYLATLPLFLRASVCGGACVKRVGSVSRVLRLAIGGVSWQVGRMAQFGLLRLDVVLLFQIAGARQAGIYSVALSLGALAQLVPGQIASHTYFRAMRRERLPGDRPLRQSIAVSLAGVLLIAIVGYPALMLLYGEAFAGAYVPLLVTLPGAVAYSAVQVQTALIRVDGTSRDLALTSVPAVAVMALALPFAVGFAGSSGAGAASSLGAIIAAVLGYIVIHRRIDQRPPNELVPSLARA